MTTVTEFIGSVTRPHDRIQTLNTHLVITVIADDRPGIVKTLSDSIKSAGGNWMESRMTRLGGKFVGILRVDISTAMQASLVATLETLADSGIRCADCL